MPAETDKKVNIALEVKVGNLKDLKELEKRLLALNAVVKTNNLTKNLSAKLSKSGDASEEIKNINDLGRQYRDRNEKLTDSFKLTKTTAPIVDSAPKKEAKKQFNEQIEKPISFAKIPEGMEQFSGITVKFGVETEAQLSKAKLALSEFATSVSSKGNEITAKFSGVGESAKKNIGEISKIARSGNVLSEVFSDSVVAKAEGAFKKIRRAALMANLGIMFFGMAIQRFMDSIIKSSMDAFTKIIAGSDELSRSFNPAYSALNALGAEFEYLRFVVGQALGTALEPFMEKIIGLVDWFARLSSEHPVLVARFIAFFSVLGGALFLLGTFNLGINSIIDSISNFKAIGHAITWIKKLGASLSATTGISIGLLAAVVLIAAAIFGVIVWIFKMKDALGGWGEFGKAVIRGFIRVWLGMPSVVQGIVESIGVYWNNMVVKLKNSFFSFVSWLYESGSLGKKVVGILGLDQWLEANKKGFGKEESNTFADILGRISTDWTNNVAKVEEILHIEQTDATTKTSLNPFNFEMEQDKIDQMKMDSFDELTKNNNPNSGPITNNVVINAYGSSIAGVEAQSNEYMAMYQKFLNNNGYVAGG